MDEVTTTYQVYNPNYTYMRDTAGEKQGVAAFAPSSNGTLKEIRFIPSVVGADYDDIPLTGELYTDTGSPTSGAVDFDGDIPFAEKTVIATGLSVSVFSAYICSLCVFDGGAGASAVPPGVWEFDVEEA